MKNIMKDIKENNLKRAYLLFGNEKFLIDKFEHNIVSSKFPDGDVMNCSYFEDKKASAKDIIDASDTLPFLSEVRMVVVRDSGFFIKGKKDETAELAKYMEKIPEFTTIVFVESAVDKRNSLYKAIEKNGYCAELNTPTENELITWVVREFKGKGINIDKPVCVYFLRTVGTDMTLLTTEMEKLTDFLSNDKTVSRDAIDSICTKTLNAQVFDIVNYMGNKKPKEALSIYNNMLTLKESPIKILSLVARQFRLMLMTRLMRDKGLSNKEISLKLKIPEFFVRDYLKQSGNFSKETLSRAIKDCNRTDVDIKNGRITDSLGCEIIIMDYSSKLN